MSSGFVNHNSTIGNQVIGTLTMEEKKGSEIEFIRQQLDSILELILADSSASKADVKKVRKVVEDVKAELVTKTPKAAFVERSLSVIGNVSSVAALVDQIRPFLKKLF